MKKSKREIKESVPFTIATKRIKYLGINLPKETKELYKENCKTLMKGIEDDTKRWRNKPHSWIGKINIMKISYTTESNQNQHKEVEKYSMFLDRKNQYCENDYTTKCNLQIPCDPYQITNGTFHRIRTKHSTICMATQKTQNSQSNLQKEKWIWMEESGSLTLG